MRLLFVVQRYGHEVAGGAEAHCREFATRLAARGHEVEVLTSCAISYATWENEIPPGPEVIDGVVVHRLPSARRRDDTTFAELDGRVMTSVEIPLYLQIAWMEAQGPLLAELDPWLRKEAARFDVVIFFTYLYYTTWAGLPAASGPAPTVLHPTAHDEPPFWLPVFDAMLRLPTAYAFSTEEEAALLQRRARITQPYEVIGVGTELEVEADASGFRERYGLGDRPYLLFVGRIVPGKGSDELHDFFVTYKQRRRGDLALVVVGEPLKPVPDHPDVFVTGFVDEETKRAAYAGAMALVQPSYFESFSMVLCEAWAASLPALVQGHCDVLVGQATRSGGALPYSGYAEFEAAVDWLCDDEQLRGRLGAAGRRYVETCYDWDAVMDRYEAFLSRVAATDRLSGSCIR